MWLKITWLLVIATAINGLQQGIDLSKYKVALEAIFGMGVRSQAILRAENTENFIISPVSITSVIGQLMLGTDGEFRDHLYELLSLPETKDDHRNTHLKKYNEKKNDSMHLPYTQLHLQLYSLMKILDARSEFKLNHKNALFYNSNLKLRPDFVTHLSYIYETNIKPLNFSQDGLNSQRYINDWAMRETNGLIKDALKETPTPQTSAIFLNAIYFSAEWEYPFSDELNMVDEFQVSETKKVNVTYMTGYIDKVRYFENDLYKMVALPYKNEELSMYIIQPAKSHPDKFDAKKFTQALDAQDILHGKENMKIRDCVVKMPKFTIKSTVSILKPLEKYKIYKETLNNNIVSSSDSLKNKVNALNQKVNVFENFTANHLPELLLTTASDQGNVKISDIAQEMIFSVNEKGTEAAAVTLGTVNYSGGQKTMILTRPFLFFIEHFNSTVTLFWGTISNPIS